jgi:hypothetical protein
VLDVQLPAVAATGSAYGPDLHHIEHAGFHRVLRKPIVLADMLTTIESLPGRTAPAI